VQGKRPDRVDPRGVWEVLIKDEGWKKVAKFGDGPPAFRAVADDEGRLLYGVMTNDGGELKRLAENGEATIIAKLREMPQNISPMPDGKILITSAREVAIVDSDGKVEQKAQTEKDISAVAVDFKANVYCQLPSAKKIRVFDANFKSRDLDSDGDPHVSLCLTPDQGFLVAVAPKQWQLTSRRIESDGTLAHPQPFYSLQALEGQDSPHVYALAADDRGRLYVSSVNGIQIFDQAGRVIGILTLPSRSTVFAMAFGGAKFDTLFVVAGDGIYSRKLNVKGVRSCKPPIFPKPPQM